MPDPAAAGAMKAQREAAAVAKIKLQPANAKKAWKYLQFQKKIPQSLENIRSRDETMKMLLDLLFLEHEVAGEQEFESSYVLNSKVIQKADKASG